MPVKLPVDSKGTYLSIKGLLRSNAVYKMELVYCVNNFLLLLTFFTVVTLFKILSFRGEKQNITELVNWPYSFLFSQ